MKKWSYIVGGFVLGLVVALSANTAYGAVQSLVGKKVTGEMTVIVDGKKLQNKGAVIDGVTNAPVRALADALGVDLKVDGKTIYITQPKQEDVGAVLIDGKYYTKYDLLNEKTKLEQNNEKIKESLDAELAKSEQMKNVTGIEKELWEGLIKTLNQKIDLNNTQLTKINEALKAFE